MNWFRRKKIPTLYTPDGRTVKDFLKARLASVEKDLNESLGENHVASFDVTPLLPSVVPDEAFHVTVEIDGHAFTDDQIINVSEQGFVGQLNALGRWRGTTLTKFFNRRNVQDTIDDFAAEAVELVTPVLRDGQQIVAVRVVTEDRWDRENL